MPPLSAVAKGYRKGVADRPDVQAPHAPPPEDRQPGPSGVPFVLATAAIFGLAVVIVVLLAIGGWVGFAVAIALMLIGVLALTRYVQRISWTRRSPREQRRGLTGMDDDLSHSDEAHETLSPVDLPHDNPARQELEERLSRRSG
ncbi:MAG: hypothetical protein JWN10_2440 [Solirubrobacterales bacterium]|nr:hypothetical protein [Solirubrobacterales bacterium]